MLKKLLSLVICVAMLAGVVLVPEAFAADMGKIKVETVAVQQGTTGADVKINISGNPGVTFMKLKVSFAEGLVLKSVDDGGLLGNANHSDNLESPYVLYWNNGTAKSDFTANGTIATLKFEIADPSAVDQYPVELAADKANTLNYADENVDFDVENGAVNVEEKPKKKITGVTFKDGEFTYDGNEKSIKVSGSLPSDATVDYNGNKGVDAGTYNATAVVKADGYYDLELEAKMTIAPKKLTVSGLSAADKSYDGTKDAVISGGTLSGVVGSDDVSAQLPEAGVFAKADAGNGIAVSIDEIVLSGEDKGNYLLTQPSALKANITPAVIKVKANDVQIVKGAEIPALTYAVTDGVFYGDDKLTGEPATNADTGKSGDYAITIGSLTAGSNYKIEFTNGTLSVVDKTPQNIKIEAISEKTYGDEAFGLVVTPDEVSKLEAFTFASSDENVAEVSAEGIVTVKSAGKTIITVKQAGDDTYAPYTGTIELTVNPKKVTVASVNPDEKTAVLEGVLDSDAGVSVDFENISIKKTDDIDENTIGVEVGGFALVGDKASNYTVITEALESTVKTENTVETKGTVEANGSVMGSGLYLKGSNATLVAVADSGYYFAGWYDGDTLVSTSAQYTFKAEEHSQLKATFKKKATGLAPSASGSGSGGVSASGCTVKFDSMGGSAVANQSVKSGSAAIAPADPTRDGYLFAGWYTDKGLTVKYDFESKVTKSVTLYAAWEVNAYADKIVLTIDNKEAIVFGEEKVNDVAPLIRNDRTMLPARFVAESLGADVAWDETAPGIVTITKGDVKIVIRIGEKIAEVNGEQVELDSPAFIENARTYTPIRFISEKLGATVDWNEETQEVTITVK